MSKKTEHKRYLKVCEQEMLVDEFGYDEGWAIWNAMDRERKDKSNAKQRARKDKYKAEYIAKHGEEAWDQHQAEKKEAKKQRLIDKLGEDGYRAYLDEKNAKQYERKIDVRLWHEKRKADGECSRCGAKAGRILQDHHFDPQGLVDPKNKKTGEVGNLVSQGKSIERCQEEADKCVLLCPNCHSTVHLDEDNAVRAEKVAAGHPYYSKYYHEDGSINLDRYYDFFPEDEEDYKYAEIGCS